MTDTETQTLESNQSSIKKLDSDKNNNKPNKIIYNQEQWVHISAWGSKIIFIHVLLKCLNSFWLFIEEKNTYSNTPNTPRLNRHVSFALKIENFFFSFNILNTFISIPHP